MKVNLPSQVRQGLYILTSVGTPFIAYLNDTGVIGAKEVALWSAEVAAIGLLAAFNTVKNDTL